MKSEYIHIMIESLEKKQNVLGQIIELNRQQKLLLEDPELSPEDFEKNMESKSDLVEQLNLLDSGFEELYERVRDELNGRKEEYASEIKKMQSLIKDITAQTNTIQTQEARNREQVTKKFADVRERVKGVRNSQKVVKQYYQTMMNKRNTDALVVDNKK